MAQIRAVEVLAALSLTTDLASGVAFEKGLRTCAVATSFARLLGLREDELRVVFQATLLRSIGCTSHASENADEFGDDIAFQAALKELDVGDPEVLRHQLSTFGSWAGAGQQAELARRFVEAAPVKGPAANDAACEVGRALGPQLGLSGDAVAALDQVYERWDGHGIPGRRSGEQLALAARIGHLAEQAVLARGNGGDPAAGGRSSRSRSRGPVRR